MKRRALELRANPRLLPKSSLGKAVNYFLNEYTAVVGYLRDGRFEIDNNLVENDVRPSVVGRKRWLFIGHPRRRLAQCGHLHHHSELPSPRHQSTGIPDRCARSIAFHEKPRGKAPAAQPLEAAFSQIGVI